MSPLEQLQADFLSMLTGSFSLTLGPSRVPAQHGLAIYRRNNRENHIKALADTYENAVALVGQNYFRQLARHYIADHPSHSGDLNDYGEHFPAFLAQMLPTVPGGDGVPWLPDIARLDWAMLRALRAPTATGSALATLTTWPADQQGKARLRLHTSCTLLRSGYPLHTLWRLAQGDDLIVDLEAGGEAVLIFRPDNEVLIRPLDAATHNLLLHWQSHTLGESLCALRDCDSAIDLGALLVNLNALGPIGELWSNA